MHIVTAPAALTPTGADTASVALIVLLSLLPVVIVYVWTALALSRVYDKVGVAGWKAWVPVYNAAVFLRLGGLSGWLLLLYLIPLFGQIFVYVAIVTAAHRIGVAFGYGAGMTVLAALLFPVWASILGFGDVEPEPGYDAYAARGGADDEHRALSPEFGRLGFEEPVLEARRDVVAPSAWIPPAEVLGHGAPVAEPVWPAPAAAPAPVDAQPPTVAYEPPAPVSAPESWDAPTVSRDPEPVTSWWMPAPEADEPPASEYRADPVDDPAPASWFDEPAPEPVAAAEPVAAPVAEPEPSPVLRRPYVAEPDAFPEASGEVSAVVGAPVAGTPRPAAASVSAYRPPLEDGADDTVIASRRRPMWGLQLPDGTTVDLTGDTAVLGRRPVPVHAAPGAQLVTVVEETRTVSKTHALLRRQGDAWVISDLGSTNGVVVDDAEVEAGQVVPIGAEFLLGDAVLRLVRQER